MVVSDISQVGEQSTQKRMSDKVCTSSTGQTTRDTAISTCNATIVELERVGICINRYGIPERRVAVQSKQFRKPFLPTVVEWLVL